MRTLKHLPVNEWPEADRQAFKAAYEPGDVFDETAGPGAHLAEGHAPDDWNDLSPLARLFEEKLS